MKFYLGKNEDCSLERQRLRQFRGTEARGKASILCGFNDRGMYSQAHTMAEAEVRSA